jgi:GLPGLI family protein
MKKLLIIVSILFAGIVNGQQFINSGLVEFEVRSNIHKVLGDGIWAEMARERLPQFATSYYHLLFDDGKSLYKYDRKDEKARLPWGNENEDDIWYHDYKTGTFTDRKWVLDNYYLMTDSLMKVDWKLVPNETRDIAGFNCRKAVGILFDSVYVFAFYTDEITISGGPMGLNGLPGMILGITIPRMYTSWVATKVQVTGVDLKKIVPPTKGKKPAADLKSKVYEATKDWGTYGQRAIWNIFL